jgi:hypothetical protein
MIKALKKLGIEGMFPQHNKGYIQQTCRKHYAKWRTTETISLKVRNETGLTAFSTLIQYSFGMLSQSNKTRTKDKSNSNKEGRSQTIPICR